MSSFVYKWTNKTNQMWYVGSRTAQNCHPDDGYICSSKVVKPMVLADPDNWVRTIIDTGTPAEMRELEEFIIKESKAPERADSYNQSYAINAEPWNKGLKGVQVSWNKGLPAEQQPKYGKPGGMKGKKQSQLNRDKARQSRLAYNKWRRENLMQCPHCDYHGTYAPRWHWDRCKNKEGN
jgi:hypothetical protein